MRGEKALVRLLPNAANWRELAETGRPEIGQIPEKIKPISDLLEKPISAAETDWLAARDDPQQRPYWLNGMPREGGENCPPAPLTGD